MGVVWRRGRGVGGLSRFAGYRRRRDQRGFALQEMVVAMSFRKGNHPELGFRALLTPRGAVWSGLNWRELEGRQMTSGCIPPKGEPGPDEILDALKAYLDDNPRLVEMPEEVARQPKLGGHGEGEPSPTLVAEALRAIEAEEADLT